MPTTTLLPTIGIALAVLIVIFMIWAYKDATSRGLSGLLIAIVLTVTFPIGLIFYALFRPEKRPLVA